MALGFNDEGKSVLETAEKIVIDLEHNEDYVLISDIDDVVKIIDNMIGLCRRDAIFRRRRMALAIQKAKHDRFSTRGEAHPISQNPSVQRRS